MADISTPLLVFHSHIYVKKSKRDKKCWQLTACDMIVESLSLVCHRRIACLIGQLLTNDNIV